MMCCRAGACGERHDGPLLLCAWGKDLIRGETGIRGLDESKVHDGGIEFLPQHHTCPLRDVHNHSCDHYM